MSIKKLAFDERKHTVVLTSGDTQYLQYHLQRWVQTNTELTYNQTYAALAAIGFDEVKTTGEFNGKFVARLANYLFKCESIKLTDEQKQQIGNLYNLYRAKPETYVFDLTQNLTWQPGTFAESAGSCWWNEYSYCRPMLTAAGGGAIRFYNSLTFKPVGRCWVLPGRPVRNGFVLFNAYGMRLHDMATVFARWLEYPIVGRVKELLNVDNAFYINEAAGVVVKPRGKLIYPRVDMGVSNVDVCCMYCKQTHPSSQVKLVGAPPDYACKACYNRHISSCDYCGAISDMNDLFDVNNHDLCNACYADNVVTCDHCGNDALINYTSSEDDGTICYNCGVTTLRCVFCNIRTHVDELNVHPSGACVSCVPHVYDCALCHRWYRDTPVVCASGEHVCSTCSSKLTTCDACRQPAFWWRVNPYANGNNNCEVCNNREPQDAKPTPGQGRFLLRRYPRLHFVDPFDSQAR